MFGADIDAAARAHAIADYPRECIGIVAGGAYVALENLHSDPDNAFLPPPQAFVEHAVAAVVHSHCWPRHGREPSAADIAFQMAHDLPLGIVLTDGAMASPPLWLGDHLLDLPLIGRDFIHGVTDCFALARGWFWQQRGIRLADMPRDIDWWLEGGNLYLDGFSAAGFRLIGEDEATEGDCVLMRIKERIEPPHHGGVLIDGGMLLHHLPGRLSRSEPYGRWRKHATHWLRFEG